jgi:hypothetical protein
VCISALQFTFVDKSEGGTWASISASLNSDKRTLVNPIKSYKAIRPEFTGAGLNNPIKFVVSCRVLSLFPHRLSFLSRSKCSK